MKCAVHSDVDATGYCRNCGKAMCAACARPVRDVLYCEDCLATVMGHPAQTARPAEPGVMPPAAVSAYAPPVVATARPWHSSPTVAFILGLFPGLGAIYNGQYNKGLIHIAIFASIIVALSTDIGEGLGAMLGIAGKNPLIQIKRNEELCNNCRLCVADCQGGANPDTVQGWKPSECYYCYNCQSACPKRAISFTFHVPGGER